MKDVILHKLRHLVTKGTYDDFLEFIALTEGDLFRCLLEISHELISMTKRITLPFDAMDICGTGGDASSLKTTNISTISAFVLASMGVPVAKHGGRAVSSNSGSVDFLDALNIPEINPADSIKKYNICFLKAQNYHHSFKNIAPFRKIYGKKTIFNLLGPLINPANITHQMVGVSLPMEDMKKYASVLQGLGRKNFAVVQSASGNDELLSCDESVLYFGNQDKVTAITIKPQEYNFLPEVDNSILGKTPQENVNNILRFFENPVRNVLCETIMLNCGVASWIFGKFATIESGVRYAEEIIFSKQPLMLIHHMQCFPRS